MSLHRRITVGLPAAGLTLFAALAMSSAASASPAVDAPVRLPAAAATETPDDTRGGDGYGATETPDVADTTAPTRGKPGYGTPSPTPSTPTASTDTVPPGVSPTSAAPSASTPGGGVSAGSLPVTGAPMGTLVTIGGLLVAAGATSVWYTRRRRSA